MGRVLGTVAGDDFVNSVITTQWEVNLNYVIARLHQSQDSFDFLALLLERGSLLHVLDERVLDNLAPAVEEIFDHIEKQRISCSWDVLKAFRNLMVGDTADLLLVAQCDGQDFRQLLADQPSLHDILDLEHFLSLFNENEKHKN